MRASPSRTGYLWFLITEVIDDLLYYTVGSLRNLIATAPSIDNSKDVRMSSPTVMSSTVEAELKVPVETSR